MDHDRLTGLAIYSLLNPRIQRRMCALYLAGGHARTKRLKKKRSRARAELEVVVLVNVIEVMERKFPCWS
jgi:hypothetical protein